MESGMDPFAVRLCPDRVAGVRVVDSEHMERDVDGEQRLGVALGDIHFRVGLDGVRAWAGACVAVASHASGADIPRGGVALWRPTSLFPRILTSLSLLTCGRSASTVRSATAPRSWSMRRRPINGMLTGSNSGRLASTNRRGYRLRHRSTQT